MFKYPRTHHIEGSKFQHGDSDMDAVPFSELRGKHLVIEEKIDGANAGISFEDNELKLQSRGHYLRGGPREKQFELLKQWAATHEETLYEVLRERYVMYGEWMFATHTIAYDLLPHYFMEFDVLDKETGKFLSTFGRDTLLRDDRLPMRIEPVRVMGVGYVGSLAELRGMVGRSKFVSDDIARNTIAAVERSQFGKQCTTELELDSLIRSTFYVGPTMEGLYVKWEEDGEVKGRYKFVRDSFVSHVAGAEEHWHDRPIVQNGLVEGGLDAMFSMET